MSTDLSPADFDLDEWIEGATRPERFVTIYRDGHLLAELDDLERRIKSAKAVPAEDRGITDDGAESLQALWDETAERFTASALNVRVRAITNKEYSAAHKSARKACDGKDDPETIGLYVLAAAIVSPAMTPVQVSRLRDKIGEPQIELLARAAQELRVKGLPKVTAPFSRPSSTSRDGDMS